MSFLLLLASTWSHVHALRDTPFEQEFSIIPPQHVFGIEQSVSRPGGGAVIRDNRDELFALSADGSSWLKLKGFDRLATGAILLEAEGQAIVVADTNGVTELVCDQEGQCDLNILAGPFGAKCGSSLHSGVFVPSTREVAVGCDDGLFTGINAGKQPLDNVPLQDDAGNAVTWVAASSDGHWLAAATSQRLHTRKGGKGGADGAWWWEWISTGDQSTCADPYTGGVIEGNVTAGAFHPTYGTKGGLFVTSNRGVQVMDLSTGEMQRFDRTEVPYANFTAITFPAATEQVGLGLWFGTAWGVVRLMDDGKWRYFEGERWFGAGITDFSVVAIASMGNGRVLISTASHATIIETRMWTLQEKAAYLQRKVSPRHDRYGYVSSCGLKVPGDLTTYEERDSDNDGLWTSMYTASQAFRFAASNDPGAKEDAMIRFNALKFLFDASGSGSSAFVARSAARVGDKIHSGGTWHNSTTKPGWLWKGDTSSDEITGHMFVYPILKRLLDLDVDTDKALTGMVDGLIKGIVQNNYTLVDPATGDETTWGIWTPAVLNTRRDWSDNRGIRALELQSYLLAAQEVTGDASFLDVWTQLRETHSFDRMMINTKITDPCDNNHSDDEETFLPLYTYHMANKALGRAPDAAYNATLARLCRVVHPEKPSLYLTICALAQGTEPDAAILEDLRSWPVDLVYWHVSNSQRQDVWPKVAPHGDQGTHAVDRRNSDRFVWNDHPYRLNSGNGGVTEASPGGFLLPYWMARHHGFIEG